jgi:hypothetical protein
MNAHSPAILAGQIIAAKADRILSRFNPSARGAEEQRRHASALLHLATQASGDGSHAARAPEDAGRISEKDRKLAATLVYDVAYDAYGRQELPEAIALFEIALSIHAHDDWRVMKGFAQVQAHDFAGARQSFGAVRGYHSKSSKYRARLCELQLQGTDLATMDAPDDPEQARVLENFRFHMRGGHHSKENREQLERERQEQQAVFQAQLAALRWKSFLPRLWIDARSWLRQALGGDPARRQDPALALAASTAREFAECLARWDFAAADAMLTGLAQPRGGAEDLRTAYLRMAQREDDGGEPDPVEVMVMETMPVNDADVDDLGWVYVAISGENFNEAVTVIVTRVAGQPCIRSLEWGRP